MLPLFCCQQIFPRLLRGTRHSAVRCYAGPMLYTFEQRIHTLAKIAVTGDQKVGFQLENIVFTYWDRDFWHDFWLATTQVDAENVHQAFRIFRTAMRPIITRVSLISQCHIESVFQPYLILKQGADIAFFRHSRGADPVGLMFMDEHLKALKELRANAEISQEFYSYWCDVVNATGYTPKLVLLFSALEALVKKANGKKDWDKLKSVLGQDLCDEIFLPITGLRHRLTHGEYLNAGDTQKNYVHIVHSKVIEYFNRSVFREQLLQENVVNPQRHPLLNKEEIGIFVKPSVPGAKLALRDVLDDFEKNGINGLQEYEPITDKAVAESY